MLMRSQFCMAVLDPDSLAGLAASPSPVARPPARARDCCPASSVGTWLAPGHLQQSARGRGGQANSAWARLLQRPGSIDASMAVMSPKLCGGGGVTALNLPGHGFQAWRQTSALHSRPALLYSTDHFSVMSLTGRHHQLSGLSVRGHQEETALGGAAVRRLRPCIVCHGHHGCSMSRL